MKVLEFSQTFPKSFFHAMIDVKSLSSLFINITRFHPDRTKISSKHPYQFHTTVFFQYPPKTSEKPWFSDVFRW